MKTSPKILLLLGAFGSLTLFTGCESMDDRTTRNTGIGAAAGAVVGGVVGHQSGNTAAGAAIGAAAGGAGGYGYSRATEDEREAERAAEAEAARDANAPHTVYPDSAYDDDDANAPARRY